jgi:transcriptional regulator with XRE-family HTH domain
MRERRLRAGLTQADLAARAGVSLGWVAEVERQPAFLTPSVAEKIAAALGCAAKDILPPAT